MADSPQIAAHAEPTPDADVAEAKRARRKRRRRRVLITLVVLIAVGWALERWALAPFVQWRVNDILSRSPLYRGRIGSVDLHLWRGAYTIRDVKLVKTTGDVPAPLFSSPRVDFFVQWSALWHGKLVAAVRFTRPQINFVDSPNASASQIGGGPWLGVLRDLFPLRINHAEIINGSVHFHSYRTTPPVDVYLNQVNGSVDNLTNIDDDTAPKIATVRVRALAMNQARLLFEMKINPFSYDPTFDLAVQLIGLDMRKTNDLTRAYAGLDFSRGWFDLVLQLDSEEGMLSGYVKPLYRDLNVVDFGDVKHDDPLTFFWEAVVGGVTGVFKNQSRDQFGTRIPITGRLGAPKVDLLATVGNILRNAFIRAYLPQLDHGGAQSTSLQFGKAEPLPESHLYAKPGTPRDNPSPLLLEPERHDE